MENGGEDLRFLEMTACIMLDDTQLLVTGDVRSAWVLVAALQLAARDRGVSAIIREEIIRIAMVYETAILLKHPEAEELLDRGWNPTYDR